jgi:hypothetical protein
MKITLQERFICFAVQHISNSPLAQYFKLLDEISGKIKGMGYQPTDEVEIEVDPNQLVNIYFGLGQNPEYLVAGVNEHMKGAITVQFTQKITDYLTLLATLGVEDLTQEEIDALPSADQEIVYEGRAAQTVVGRISSRDSLTNQIIENMMAEGRRLVS